MGDLINVNSDGPYGEQDSGTVQTRALYCF